ncbi:MAG TPA: hypothetical protein VHD62_05110 [Opitutaceae bacterium]|nr:hypothetical protein [Opitutaceae bacterium]
MNARRSAFLSALCAFALAASSAAPAAEKAAAKPPGAPPLSPRFLQVRERIDALLHNHDAPLSAAELQPNPFRAAGFMPAPSPAETAPGAAGTTPVEAPTAELNLLQQGVALLRVSGVVDFGGQQHLVINSRPYKEGDVIPVQVNGQPVYLRIRQIAPHLVTFALDHAEMTLKF